MSLSLRSARRAPWFAGLLRLSLSLCLALASALTLGPAAPPVQAGFEALEVDRADDVDGLACTPGNTNDCTLRSAVSKANTDANESFITFRSNYTITLGSSLMLTEAGTIVQATAGQVIEINANNTGQVFRISASDSTLEGLRMYGSNTGTAIVWISDSAQRVRLVNNIIGDDDPGFAGACGNSPNSQSGVYISSDANPAPGDAVAWIYGNNIKCVEGAPGHGIQIAGSREVVIGANSSGLAGSAQMNFIENNDGDAVHLSGDTADDNVIRNSALQNSNGSGLVIDGGDSNEVYGNYLQANDQHGILLTGGARLNTIGCPLLAGDPSNASLRNVIRYNDVDGIRITDAGTDSNLILCNWIGLNDAGTGPAANLGNGVQIMAGADSNIIGVNADTRNVISGNSVNGVLITGTGTDGNLVQGNYIGTNVTATGVVGNGLDGVGLTGGATLNIIGGSSAHNLNIIGGNGANGVYISGSTTATNTVRFNDIGLNSSVINYLPLPNGQDGIHLQLSTHGNILGGTAMANYIAYNGGEGVSLSIGAYNNQFHSEIIFSNATSGVLLVDTGTTNNQFFNLIIRHNGQDGIAERGSATANTWSQMSIHSNGGLGIDRNATSTTTNTPTTPYPVITGVNVGTGQLQGLASNNATVEVYRAAPDPSGFGEGRTYLGTAIASGAGLWSLTVPAGQSNCYTAFQTVAGASSEFGPHTCPTVYVPLTFR